MHDRVVTLARVRPRRGSLSSRLSGLCGIERGDRYLSDLVDDAQTGLLVAELTRARLDHSSQVLGHHGLADGQRDLLGQWLDVLDVALREVPGLRVAEEDDALRGVPDQQRQGGSAAVGSDNVPGALDDIDDGADHAFPNDTGTRYNADAARDAWARTLDWFARYVRA